MEKFSFWTIFAVVFLAEIPCILRTMAIQVKTEGIWTVVFGTIAGSLVALLVGIFLAKVLTISIPEQYINWIQTFSGLALMAIGAMIVFHQHHH